MFIVESQELSEESKKYIMNLVCNTCIQWTARSLQMKQETNPSLFLCIPLSLSRLSLHPSHSFIFILILVSSFLIPLHSSNIKGGTNKIMNQEKWRKNAWLTLSPTLPARLIKRVEWEEREEEREEEEEERERERIRQDENQYDFTTHE